MSDATFPGIPQSVGHARRFAGTALFGVPPDDLSDIILMVSELTTNAVRHAATDFTLTVERSGDDVRVEVWDTGAGVPQVRDPTTSTFYGRGLQIVHRLADQWGVEQPDPARGKGVWFTRRLGRP